MNTASKKSAKAKNDSVNDSRSKHDPSKTFKPQNETAAERQRLAKEKSEFKKLKEKYDADCLTLEKQKRDFDKQKLEFEKYKDVENK